MYQLMTCPMYKKDREKQENGIAQLNTNTCIEELTKFDCLGNDTLGRASVLGLRTKVL